MERLQKVIATSGVCSRRKAEEKIINNKVKVNGKVINTLGFKVRQSDKIEVDDILIEKNKQLYYILLNKPRAVVSTTKDEKNRKTVIDIINIKERIYPVGRLDYDTTGLLLLTNDGDFANMLMHPSNKIDKVYIAKVKGIVTGYDVKRLKNGVIIDGKRTSEARVKLKSIDKDKKVSIVEITIHEGKNHQIKKMFSSLGLDVLKLKRTGYSFLTLDGVKVGEYRMLNQKEVKRLYSKNGGNI
ncbi:MAG: pseudouridine synthase [bacterium]|nr:pseudouridine synthase [bacterium]